MNRHDRSLIYQSLTGNTEAFGFLVDQYKESVYALAYSRLGNPEDAEDVAQEAFLKAYQKLRTLRWWDAFPAWLYAITANLCRTRLHSRTRGLKSVPLESSTSGDSQASWINYQDRQAQERIQDALHALPEIHREILCLHYMTGLDGREISQLLRISYHAVHKRLSRARAMLKEILLEEETLETISADLGSYRLGVGFTFRVMEMIQQARPQPSIPTAWLPWMMAGMGITLTTMIAWNSLGTDDKTRDSAGSGASETSNAILVSFEPSDEESESIVLQDSLPFHSQDATDNAELAVTGHDFAIGNEDGSIPREWVIVGDDYSIYDEDVSDLMRNSRAPFIVDKRVPKGYTYRREFVYPIRAPKTGWYLVRILGDYDGFDALHERYSINISAGSRPPVNASRTSYAGPIDRQTGVVPTPEAGSGWQWMNHGRFYLEQELTYWVHFSPVPGGHSIRFGPGGRIELVAAADKPTVQANIQTVARGHFVGEVYLFDDPNPGGDDMAAMLGPPDGRRVSLDGGRTILGFANEPVAFDWDVEIPANTGLILVNAGIEVEDIHFGFGFSGGVLGSVLVAKVNEAHIGHTIVSAPSWNSMNPRGDAVLHFYALDADFRLDSSIYINANDNLHFGNLGVDAVFFIPRNIRKTGTE